MKKLILIPALCALLSSCEFGKVYTMSSLDKTFSTDIENGFMWQCITKNGDTVTLDKLKPKLGDTIEIVHTDYTTSKYILTDIK